MIRDIVGSIWCETKILSHSQSCYLFQVWYTNVLVHAELHMIYAALSKVPRCCQVWWIRVPLVVLYALLNTIQYYGAYGPQGIKLFKQIGKKNSGCYLWKIDYFFLFQSLKCKYNKAIRCVFWVAQKIHLKA